MNLPEPKRILVSDISLNVYDAGNGPAVVLCHGFPDLARSWHHQFNALVAAGYRVIAPDQRGYGGSDAPKEIESYDLTALTGDLVGLLDALEIERAVFVGHDWGAFVVWAMPVLHPSRCYGIVGVNVPNMAFPTTELLGMMFPNPDDFYILWFQKHEIPEAHINGNLRTVIDLSYQRRDHGKVGDAPVLTLAERNANPILTLESPEPDGLPILSDTELEDYCAAHSRNGFFGPTSWYRNIDRNAELLPQVGATPLDLPVLQIEVPEDAFVPANAGDITRALCSDVEVVSITQSGHWTMLEQPEALTSAILDWLERKYKTSDPV